ncbi:MAG: translation initiation factor IF-2 [Gammaproteobacteria bacterium]
MSEVTVQHFAKQIGVSVEKLLDQLQSAGIGGKSAGDFLEADEKTKLLEFLQGDVARHGDAGRHITLKRKVTGEIKQTSRTGAARTVQVEVKKRRTFIKRSVVEEKEAEAARSHAREIEEKVRIETAREAARDTAEKRETKPAEQAAARQSGKAGAPETTPGAGKAGGAEAGKEKPDEKKPPQAAVTAATEKRPPPPAVDAKERKVGAKSRKGKTGERAKLHVARERRRRRHQPRKHGRISSTISDAHAFAKPTAPVVREVGIPESISAGELAQAMSVKAAEVIKTLMAMGTMVTINQPLDRDTAMLAVEEMGHVAKAVDAHDPEARLLADFDATDLQPRAPVVTVMGHVDHGKTSLLDYLRKTRVAAGEAGGITQHIGAYKVALAQGEICFLDTPGHEAFSAMRVRGAKATDLVILVVAADDGVKPQTIEAIHHARAAEAPIIVAINKIDREQADAARVRQELSAHAVIGEKWGGDVLMNEISALSGAGIDALLESVLLQAEVLDLKARASGPAVGRVIEARLDKGKGPVATVLVQQGILRGGDTILAGHESGRVRVLSDDQGRVVTQAGPSTPVEIQGLAGVPVAGDDLFVVDDERKAREIALLRESKHREVKLAQRQKSARENMLERMGEAESKSLNLLIKGDVQGSVEAISDALEKISGDEVSVKVVHGMVGGINESDVNLAMASGAVIIGFNVRADATARGLIEREGVSVQYHSVIYDAVDFVKDAVTGMLPPLVREERLGLAEVREVFKAPKLGAIAGAYVSEGAVRRDLPVRVLRDNIVIFEGAIDSLRRFKDDVSEVKNGLECGIGVKNYNDIKAGDQIEVYEIIETTRQL